MGDNLAGKVAVVTGGTRGIGRAIAERLLGEGLRVAICGRTTESVDQVVEALRAKGEIFGTAADVSRYDDVRKFFLAVDAQFGVVDFLINNAGVGVFRKVAEMTPEEWHRNVDINLNGPFYCSREALSRFRGRGGYIINISSLAGKNPFSGGAGYNASKFGLNGFSEAMMLDHRYDNVRVSYIMPGSVATEFGPRPEDTSWMIAPEDVAVVVSMLLHMPERTMVSRIEMRPSKPRKS